MDQELSHISLNPGPRPPSTSLLALPSEIIKAVVEIVGANTRQKAISVEYQFAPTDWADLVNFGLCCRALHALAAPIYQRRLMVSERAPFADLVCPPLSPRPEWEGLCDQRPNAHLVRQQCERLCASHAHRLAHVASLGFSCLIATGDDQMDREIMPETLVDATCNLLSMTPQLRFLCLDGLTSRLIDAMLSINPASLHALTLNRIHAAGPSRPMPYPILAQLRALKLNFCNQAWLALIPHTTHLEDLAIQGEIRDLKWFETTNLLLGLRSLNLQDSSLPPALVLELCDQILRHRQSGQPMVLQEFGLLTEFAPANIDAVCSCLRNYTGLRSLILPVTGNVPEDIVLICESISNGGFLNLRYLELAVDSQTDDTHMFPGTIPPSAFEGLAKIANLQTLVFDTVFTPGEMSPMEDVIDYFALKAAHIFLHCPSLKTVAHAHFINGGKRQICEVHKGDKADGGVPVVMLEGECSQPHGSGGFEARWAD